MTAVSVNSGGGTCSIMHSEGERGEGEREGERRGGGEGVRDVGGGGEEGGRDIPKIDLALSKGTVEKTSGEACTYENYVSVNTGDGFLGRV